MKNIFEIIKKTWLLFILLFIAPIIVVAVFMIKEYILFNIDLSAGEWSALLGSVFSYWGTIILGTLAFWQNDRIMRLEERNAEIQETELKSKNKPDFSIDKASILLTNSDERELKLETLIKPDYRDSYQSLIKVSEDSSFVVINIVLKNSSNAAACNVEVFESILNKDFKDKIFVMGSHVYKVIEENESIILSYYIYFNEITPINGVKIVRYSFNLNYENIFHHFFFNNMEILICNKIIDEEESEIVVRVSIGEQNDGKVDLGDNMRINNEKAS